MTQGEQLFDTIRSISFSPARYIDVYFESAWRSELLNVLLNSSSGGSSQASSPLLAMASNLAGVQPTTTKPPVLQLHAEERKRLVDEYFKRTKLLQVVGDFMMNLATSYKAQLRLSANPYPELLKTMRMHEVRQAFALQSNCTNSSSLVLTVLSGQTSTTPQCQVCSVEHEQFALPIWGVRSFLEQLTDANLYSLTELMSSAFHGLVIYQDFQDDDCLATGYGVLVGDCTLGSRVQGLVPGFLELETHVCVSGQHLEKAMAVFARFLLKKLHEAINAATAFASLPPDQVLNYDGCVACDGVTITPLSALGYGEPVVWSIDRVKESQVAFVNAVKTALVSNSLISLKRFESAQLPDFDGTVLCEIEQTFFLHFNVVKGSKTTSNGTTSRRSFLSGSRALSTGIFFHSQGALEIVVGFRHSSLEKEERKKQPQTKKQLAAPGAQSAVSTPATRPRTGFVDILHTTMDTLRQVGLSGEKFRHQANCLVWCFAYNLGQLIAAHQILQNVLGCGKCSAAMAILVRARFMSLETRMKSFMEETKESPLTSVLLPVWSLVHRFYSDAKTASAIENEGQIGEFVEVLARVIELLLPVIRVVFGDFLRLVRTILPEATSATNLQPANCTFVDEIDVLRALEVAVEERKYPPSIVLEAVFAQAIIDSCLDVALESAVMNTIAIRLPPNPFIDMSMYLQAFALRQLVWRQELPTIPATKIRKFSIVGLLELVLMEDTGVCSVNPRLFQLVGCAQLIQTHRWLMDHHVFHDGTYKPSNSSYSVVIIPMLLVFRPLLLAKEISNDTDSFSLLGEVDTMEHYLVEGKELAQARLFFIDAVHCDMRRIIAACGSSPNQNCWIIRAKALVIDPQGQAVREFSLSSLAQDDILEIIEESARQEINLKVVIEIAEERTSGDWSRLTIHKVSKIYAFHHQSTEETATGSSTRLSRLMSFQVFEYGVFLSKENALLCLKNMEFDPEFAGIHRDKWTPYASEALSCNDTFLICELELVHNTSRCSCPQQCRDCELTRRLVVHSSICQLFSLEQAIRWLQSSLQQLIPSEANNVDTYSDLPLTAVITIQYRLALQIIMQIEQLVVPLNHQLQFVDEISGPLATFRACVSQWQSIQPPTEDQLNLQRKQPDRTRAILSKPQADPILITTELVNSLRTTWALVVFFRFAYQRAFFANAECRHRN